MAKDNVKCEISIDTTQAINAIENLKNALSNLESKSKYRIEFDNINNIHVYVDGKEKAVASLVMNWETDTAQIGHKSFTLKTVDDDSGSFFETMGQSNE